MTFFFSFPSVTSLLGMGLAIEVHFKSTLLNGVNLFVMNVMRNSLKIVLGSECISEISLRCNKQTSATVQSRHSLNGGCEG